jgi:hypothetical protein
MRNWRLAATGIVVLFFIALGLGCNVMGGDLGIRPLAQSLPTPTFTVTRTRIPQEFIDFNATAIAATVQAEGGYIVTSTPPPVFPTATPTPFDQVSFLATINAQFANATSTALALATPTFTPGPTVTPPPPRVLPPAGGRAPGQP